MKIQRTTEGSETWTTPSSCSSAEIRYFVIDMKSKEEAVAAIYADKPSRYFGLPYQSIRFEGYSGDENAEFSVVYAKQETSTDDYADETEEPTTSFDCSGGSKRVTHAIAQQRIYGLLNPGNMVGWNGRSGAEMDVAGVDVPVGQMRETYTRIMSLKNLTTAYKRRVARLVGKVNSLPFKGWEAGEVMFLGASYSTPTKSKEKVVVTYNFQIQENEQNTVIEGITVGYKRGWDYIWGIPSSSVNESLGTKATINSLFIAQITEYEDFSELGL